MNSFIESLMGLDTLTDQVIAMDLLTSTKSAIKLYALAATEAATPDLRATFEKHLFEAIDTHATVTEYMMQKGFYHPFNVAEQLQLDRTTVQTALQLN